MNQNTVKMKTNLFAFGMIIFSIIALVSCNTAPKNKAGEPAQTASTNPTKEDGNFQPGPGYTLSWADEFEGTEPDTSNWNRQVLEAGHFNGEFQRYTDSDENAYLEDGCLVIKIIHTSDVHGMGQYTSARLNTAKKRYWKYGKIVARIKLPYGKGIWPAFWMLGENIDENGGDTPWPQCGEIDILELYGSRDNAEVQANIHYADSSGQHAMMGAVPYKLKDGIFADDFHIFELDWDADSIAWLVDGNQYASASITGAEFTEFHHDFFLLFNIAVGSKWAGSPDESTDFPQYMYIDWVRVYQKEK